MSENLHRSFIDKFKVRKIYSNKHVNKAIIVCIPSVYIIFQKTLDINK